MRHASQGVGMCRTLRADVLSRLFIFPNGPVGVARCLGPHAHAPGAWSMAPSINVVSCDEVEIFEGRVFGI
jgi:hypothetical protein